MNFTTLTFLFIFIPVLLIIYCVMPIKFRNLVLFVFSCLFYYLCSGKYVVNLLGLIVLVYVASITMEKLNVMLKRIILLSAILIICVMLCYYKYTDFIINSINMFMCKNIELKNIVMPAGISFFSFQAISYLIDVYRGEPAQRKLVSLGAYITCFPQLVAGPIVRYKTVRDQLNICNRKICLNRCYEGGQLFIIGLSKKTILANGIGGLANIVFNGGEICQYSASYLWLGAIAYSFQIYFDFSGYSDMAIGLGKVFGFDFPQNFNYPYTAATFKDFWKRWHITLSEWFRDYVYIPLGGSRKSNYRTCVNLLIVWLLTGLWHGSNWNFIIWGLGYFCCLLFERIVSPLIARRNIRHFYRIIVLIFIVMLWVVFRCSSLDMLLTYFKGMFCLNHNELLDAAFMFQIKNYWKLLIICGIFSCPIFKIVENRYKNCAIYSVFKNIALIMLLIIGIISILVGGYNPFLYYIF